MYVNSTDETRNTIYEAIKHSEENKKMKTNFYSSYAWKKTRNSVRLRDDNIDIWEYLKTGKIQKGSVVHHIIPREENKSLELDMYNLVTVSAKSHKEIENIYYRCPEDKPKIQKILAEEARRRTELFVHGKEI